MKLEHDGVQTKSRDLVNPEFRTVLPVPRQGSPLVDGSFVVRSCRRIIGKIHMRWISVTMNIYKQSELSELKVRSRSN